MWKRDTLKNCDSPHSTPGSIFLWGCFPFNFTLSISIWCSYLLVLNYRDHSRCGIRWGRFSSRQFAFSLSQPREQLFYIQALKCTFHWVVWGEMFISILWKWVRNLSAFSDLLDRCRPFSFWKFRPPIPSILLAELGWTWRVLTWPFTKAGGSQQRARQLNLTLKRAECKRMEYKLSRHL